MRLCGGAGFAGIGADLLGLAQRRVLLALKRFGVENGFTGEARLLLRVRQRVENVMALIFKPFRLSAGGLQLGLGLTDLGFQRLDLILRTRMTAIPVRRFALQGAMR